MVNPDFRFNSGPVRSTTPSGSTRPAGEPASGSKNFEKVMKRDERNTGQQPHKDDKIDKNDAEGVDQENEEALDDANTKPQEKPASIFDLSGTTGKLKPPPNVPQTVPNEQSKEQALVEMAENKNLSGRDKTTKEQMPKTIASAESPKKSPEEAVSKDTDDRSPVVEEAPATPGKELSADESKNRARLVAETGEKKDSIKDTSATDRKKNPVEFKTDGDYKNKNRSDFAREQTDLTYTNPQSQAQQQAPLVNPMGDSKTPEAPRNQSQMKELVDQIVKEMYVVKSGDVTDTVMTIRSPPIFEGAQVKVTSFESARGELNIAFENLTQQAKDLLDSRVNRESLLLALNKEGYNVHILTTSTTTETPTYIPQADKRDQEQQQQGQQGRGQQEQQKEQQKKKG